MTGYDRQEVPGRNGFDRKFLVRAGYEMYRREGHAGDDRYVVPDKARI
jgi:hypothetical protein